MVQLVVVVVEVEMLVVVVPPLSSPALRVEAGLTPQSPHALRRDGRPHHVLQGGTPGQPGVIVGGGVGADVVVLLAHITVPAVTVTT